MARWRPRGVEAAGESPEGAEAAGKPRKGADDPRHSPEFTDEPPEGTEPLGEPPGGAELRAGVEDGAEPREGPRAVGETVGVDLGAGLILLHIEVVLGPAEHRAVPLAVLRSLTSLRVFLWVVCSWARAS